MQADIERLIARLLTDAALRARFVADPAAHGLSVQEAASMARLPAQDLLTAARSYAAKRNAKRRWRVRTSALGWLRMGRPRFTAARRRTRPSGD